MTITVQLFASYAETLGAKSIRVELPEGATVKALMASLSKFPGASNLPPKPLVAVNLGYATDDLILKPGDEVAVIPPVAGG